MNIEPLKSETKVNTIVFSFNEGYAKYFSVALVSLAESCDGDCIYDLIVLYDDLSAQTRKRLLDMIPNASFSLRFYDVRECAAEYLGDLETAVKSDKWVVSTFYDLLVPLIMPGYDRVLYSDADLIYCKDPKELFDLSFDGKQLIAIRDNFSLSWDLDRGNTFLNDQADFIREKLGVVDFTEYFNTGIILFNNPAIDKELYLKRIRTALSFPELPTVDQDVLNYVFLDAVTYAPSRFNVQAPVLRLLRRVECAEEQYPYYSDIHDPVVVHYTTHEKPWVDPDCEMKDLFWDFAKLSPFVDEIIDDGMNKIRSSYKYPKLKLIVSGIMSKLFHGSWDRRFHRARQINKILKCMHDQKTKS
jgi:lipopolysaccharide biosynthesis glycosyltransferase